MFEKFTDRARKVMSLARQESQRLNCEVIGTEHILLGLVQEGGGVATKALAKFNVDLNRVRHLVERCVSPSTSPTVTLGQIPFSPRAKRVIELAGEEASRMRSDVIGTGHLLLACLVEDDGIAAKVLRSCDVNVPGLQKVVQDLEEEGQTVTRPAASMKTKIHVTFYKKASTLPAGQPYLVADSLMFVQSASIAIEGLSEDKKLNALSELARQHGADAFAVRESSVPDA